MDYKNEVWSKPEILKGQRSFSYWNDKKIESGKVFDVSDDDYDKVTKKLEEKGVIEHVEHMFKRVALSGTGIELGAGVCWLEPIMFSHFKKIDKVYCVEFSEHRIFDLAPRYLSHEKVDGNKCVLCLGDFSELKVEDESLDFAVFCQALHHSFELDKTLRAISNKLRPGGTLLIIAEHITTYTELIKRYVYHWLSFSVSAAYRKEHAFVAPYLTLCSDVSKGDMHYLASVYREKLVASGFSIGGEYMFKKRISMYSTKVKSFA